MTTMGRQISQSGSQSNDNMFMKMMHSAGAQHFNNPAGMQQDNMNYGSPSFDRQRFLRQSRSVNSGAELFNPEPSTPPVYSRCASSRNNDARLSPSDLSPGIFDVHSIDTELLPEVSVLGLQDSSSSFLEREFSNDMDLFPSNRQQQGNRPRVPFDSSPLRNVSTEKAPPGAKIKVVVRKRPLNKKEISRKEDDIVTIEPNHTALTVHETKQKVDLTAYVERHEFVFDAVLDERVSNEEVYRVTVEPIVPAIFQKTKATCFAYGQTGSGKTFTMQPLPLKASQDILRLMDEGYRSQGCQLCVSFFEIYGGKLYDLLSDRRKLCMREDGKQQVCIVGLQEFRVYDVETIKELIERGNSARSTGTTGANEESSRSHAILQLVIKKSVDGNETKPPRPLGKLSFIDLAGSERGADTTDNDRQTRMEGAEINKSLLALKECIRALDNDQVHIPFRGSKLTEVLRDSFVGDSRTVMISCISPNSGSCEHTLNTLRYADRVKSLSKSGNSKKDTTSSTSALRESSVAPLPSQVVSENNLDLQNDYSRFGGYRQSESEGFQQFNMDRGPPSGRKEGIRSGPLYADTRDNNSFTANGNEIYYGEEILEDERQTFVNANRRSKVDRHYDQNQKSSRDMINSDIDVLDPDDEFSAVYREEVDLVAAHRKQVEDTIDLVKEEMQLLLDIDTPGQPIEGYLTKLRDILSQKAQGILNLQSRLSRFQRILSDQNILAPPATTSKQL